MGTLGRQPWARHGRDGMDGNAEPRTFCLEAFAPLCGGMFPGKTVVGERFTRRGKPTRAVASLRDLRFRGGSGVGEGLRARKRGGERLADTKPKAWRSESLRVSCFGTGEGSCPSSRKPAGAEVA